MLIEGLKQVLRRSVGQDRLLDLSVAPRAFFLDGRCAAARPASGRIAVVSMWDGRQSALAAISAPNKAAYCARRGYDWLPHTSGFLSERPVAWSKLHFIREALADHDWVFWSDADSLVMNPTIALEDFTQTAADLVITRDHHGINSGSFLLRRSEWSHRFIEALWACPEAPDYQKHFNIWTDRLWENRAFWMVLNRHEYRRHTLVVPQRRLNSYARGLHPGNADANFQPGDFILHLPGIPDARRLPILRAAVALAGPPRAV